MLLRLLIFVALLLPSAGSYLFAQEAQLWKSAETLLAKIDSITPQIEAELALFREKVKTGAEKDGWTEEQKDAALRWLGQITAPDPKTLLEASDFQRIVTPALRSFVYPTRTGAVITPKPPSGPATELSDWLATRVKFLLGFRVSLIYRFARETIAEAEEIWTQASTPAEFRSIASAISKLDERDFDLVLKSDFTIRPAGIPWPFADESRRTRDEFTELRILTAPEKCLILPDPVTDPEAFWKARKIWLSLRKINFSVLERPRLVAHFNALNRRFAEASAAARGQVERLILQDAPPETFARTLDRLHAFEIKPFNVFANPPKRPPTGPPIHTYLDEFSRNQHELPLLSVATFPTAAERKENEHLSAILQSCNLLLALRKATENGQSPEILGDLQSRFTESLMSFPEAVRTHLTHKYGKGTDPGNAVALKVAPQPGPPQKMLPSPSAQASLSDPVAMLIAEFERIAVIPKTADATKSQDSEESPAFAEAAAAATLLNAWRPLSKGEAHELSTVFEEAWQRLATRAGSLKLIALRDQATSRLLAQFPKMTHAAAESPEMLSDAFRGRLRETAISGDLGAMMKLVTLDFAANVLPSRERDQWAQALGDFTAAAAATNHSPNEARAHYLHILKVTGEPACAELAARRLKDLSLPDNSQK